MAAVLLMVGRGEEAPGIVATLLDVERTPRKPQYAMASGGCFGMSISHGAVVACVRGS